VARGSSIAEYSARTAYRDSEVAAGYERVRFSGLLGRYRWRREQAAVGELVGAIPSGSTVLDCPCGTGRWWNLLLTRAKHITAMDISNEMVAFASKRPEVVAGSVELIVGDAEAIPLANDSVDYVFSHALTKHLPWPVQYNVLAEFARVARHGVICSFSVITPLKYRIWRRQRLVESFPFMEEELYWMAGQAGLRVIKMRNCTTPVGVERTVLFEKLPA